MLTLEDLIDIVKSEASYRYEQAQRLKPNAGKNASRDQFYKHQHLYSAMNEISGIISKQHLSVAPLKTDSLTESLPKAETANFNSFPKPPQSKQLEVSKCLSCVDGFQGIDPFDTNITLMNRIDAAIIYIMSDGKQRNSKAISAELINLLPNEEITEKVV